MNLGAAVWAPEARGHSFSEPRPSRSLNSGAPHSTHRQFQVTHSSPHATNHLPTTNTTIGLPHLFDLVNPPETAHFDPFTMTTSSNDRNAADLLPIYKAHGQHTGATMRQAHMEDVKDDENVENVDNKGMPHCYNYKDQAYRTEQCAVVEQPLECDGIELTPMLGKSL